VGGYVGLVAYDLLGIGFLGWSMFGFGSMGFGLPRRCLSACSFLCRLFGVWGGFVGCFGGARWVSSLFGGGGFLFLYSGFVFLFFVCVALYVGCEWRFCCFLWSVLVLLFFLAYVLL